MDLLRDFRSRFAVTAGALAGFALIYPFIYAWGGPGMTALCALPILVAGYLFGLRAGAIVGFVIFPLSVLELVAFRVPAADLVLKTGGAAPAAVLVMTLVGAVVGQLRDLGQRVEAESRARVMSDRRFDDLFEFAHDVIFTYDLDCTLTSINPAAERLLGYSRTEMVGMDPGILIPGDQWERVRAMLQDCLDGQVGALPYEIEWMAKDGRRLILEISPLLVEEQGRPLGIQAIARDVTERKRVEERLRHQALHDALTGLPNRTLLEDRLARALKGAARNHEVLAVMIVDLEEFKAVNDTFGHQVGDDVLRQAGALLAGAMRESDTLARMGGDEFGIVLRDVHDEAGALVGAHHLLSALEQSPVVEGQRISVGASVGIALYPVHGDEPVSLIRRADVALYSAKRAGTDQAVYKSEDDQYNPRRLALRAELREAIMRRGLELHFQPKLSCSTGAVSSVEALVRWPHPDHGLLLPAEFIPIAEQSDLIGPLTDWVIGEALQWSDRWTWLGFDVSVAVNLSPRQLLDRQLPESIAEAIKDHPSGAGRLQLELTESAVMADAARALEILTRLNQMGIRLSIDDFGTGYSSLSYLRRLPVREIKIDRSFVHDLARSDADATIVRSIIDLGHNLGLSVVAEGVEDSTSQSILSELGCDLVQGYHVSRPLPGSALEAWLRQRTSGPAVPTA